MTVSRQTAGRLLSVVWDNYWIAGLVLWLAWLIWEQEIVQPPLLPLYAVLLAVLFILALIRGYEGWFTPLLDIDRGVAVSAVAVGVIPFIVAIPFPSRVRFVIWLAALVWIMWLPTLRNETANLFLRLRKRSIRLPTGGFERSFAADIAKFEAAIKTATSSTELRPAKLDEAADVLIRMRARSAPDFGWKGLVAATIELQKDWLDVVRKNHWETGSRAIMKRREVLWFRHSRLKEALRTGSLAAG